MLSEKEVILAESSDKADSESSGETQSAEATADEAEAQSKDTQDRKQRNNSKRGSKPSAEQVVAWFAACARCSFFLSAYRLEQDNDAFVAATNNSKAGWLSLEWNQALCKLVRKSYGSLLDIDCYHYVGSCPECHRQFVYHVSEDQDNPSSRFRIELKPRAGR
jgi:hypothetical protein